LHINCPTPVKSPFRKVTDEENRDVAGEPGDVIWRDLCRMGEEINAEVGSPDT